MDNNKLLDLSGSNLLLEGTKKDQKSWSRKISDYINDLQQDRSERKNAYIKRKDFYEGNQGDYSNINGVVKDTKQKKGHTNTVTNYAGKTTVKIAMGLANNPPKLSTTPEDITDQGETIRAQAVEDYIDSVFDHKVNKFWKSSYRLASFHQSEFGNAAIKCYPEVDKKQICIELHNDLTMLSVIWNGKTGGYDGVIAENLLTSKQISDKYGIVVNMDQFKGTDQEDSRSFGSWDTDPWGTRTGNRPGLSGNPKGKNKVPKLRVVEFDSEDVYAIKIEGELVSLVFKDDVTFPKVCFWTIVHNIPNPPSPWSMADIDFLMDPQIELNENDNRSSDHLRVGNVQRYVAYNMNDFDPESLKTSSGQVIFVNDPDGKARFEPLQTNINNFPDDQYYQRKMSQIYDMGLPKVNYGASGADSGRSKAIDYQSSIDLTTFKRDAWELALQEICEKIQIFGNFLHEDVDWFQDVNGNFITRHVEFDWDDVLPISSSDKIVNIANKVNMVGISLKTALKELGYRNPDAEIALLKKELADPELMVLRSKMWNFSQGILTAQNAAAMQSQTNGTDTSGVPVNQGNPTLTSDQNTGAQPMAAQGGTTSYSSPNGQLKKMQQNQNAQ